jgi:hypothetical protein
MTFTYRPADKEDSARLAELINMASDGVVEYLFHDLIPGMTPVQVVAHNLENDSLKATNSFHTGAAVCFYDVRQPHNR